MQLSRLVDGDLPEAERDALIDAVLADPELAERWKRYHALGDLMRDGGLGADIGPRVRAALDAGARVGSDAVVPLRARVNLRGWLAPRGSVRARPALGLALAASVALATVVGLRVLVPEQAPALATASSGAGVPAGDFAGNVMPAGFGATPAAGMAPLAQPGSDGGAMAVAAGLEGGAAPSADLRLAEYLEQHRREVQTGMLADQEIPAAVEPLR